MRADGMQCDVVETKRPRVPRGRGGGDGRDEDGTWEEGVEGVDEGFVEDGVNRQGEIRGRARGGSLRVKID